MKISELMVELQKAMDEHGDIPVIVYSFQAETPAELDTIWHSFDGSLCLSS